MLKERLSELQNRSTEITQSEEQEGKKDQAKTLKYHHSKDTELQPERRKKIKYAGYHGR